MAFREVSVVSIREILRLWLRGHGERAIARHVQLDRKTVHRYIDAAQAAGLSRSDSDDKLTDELIGQLVDAIRVGRPQGVGHGRSWKLLEEHKDFIKERLEKKLKLVKIHRQLERHTGEKPPYRTLHRFCQKELGYGPDKTTVLVDDPDPGQELQIDFGKMGLLFDDLTGRRRVVWALIFTAAYSRHMFVWLTFSQTLEQVITACEAAWVFFGGVFRVVIPDNFKAIVDQADPLSPRINDRFYEYAQERGFVIDPTRIAHPKDKPRVERTVPYARESFFRGEDFMDLKDAQGRAVAWCMEEAGLRIHRTIQRRPLEVFELEEKPLLLPAPQTPYDVPLYSEPKVHRDHHIAVQKALYSVPGDLIGKCVRARADSHLVKVYYRGRLIKVHPRKPPGGRSTDPNDYPEDKRAYALRDLGHLIKAARSKGPNVGTYAEALLDNPLPWTKMRQVYRLLGLVRRYGAERVDEACARSLQLDVVEVTRIARMLERALESAAPAQRPSSNANVVPLRFVRSADDFKTDKEVRDDN